MRAKPGQTLRLVGKDRTLALSRVEVGAAENVKQYMSDERLTVIRPRVAFPDRLSVIRLAHHLKDGDDQESREPESRHVGGHMLHPDDSRAFLPDRDFDQIEVIPGRDGRPRG